MDRFVTRAPTWKTLEMSSFSRSFANVSLTGKKSTPKQANMQTNKRLSIRDENLLKIFTSQPDEPLMIVAASGGSPFNAVDFDGSFGVSPAVNHEKHSQNSRRLIRNDENTPPPNARITSIGDELVGDVMCSSGESNSRPSTPISNMKPANLESCTPKNNPYLSRIQRDLNSPSAATRIRAIKALRSPTKSSYANFDIPHEEQDIITDEERKSPVKIDSIQELMKDVVVYVEVRTGEDNRSSGVKKVISAMGARVNDKLLRDTTHVVFKDGLQSTYNKAKKWNIPIVSILWIEACKKQMRLMSPKDFPISNADRYENPELYDKMKRYKSMQPDAEENRRQRAKAPTKENGVKSKPIPATAQTTNPIKKKTDISRFFTQLDKIKNTPSNSNALPPSPCTQMLQRINEKFCTPASPADSLQKQGNIDTVSHLLDTNSDGGVKKMLNFEDSENNEAPSSTKKTPGRRRNSIQVTQTPQNDSINKKLVETDSIPATPNTRSRRRSSIHIPTNMSVTEKSEEKSSKMSYATIREDISEENGTETDKRQTTFTEQSVDISKGTPLQKNHSTRRRTLYTPKPMEESKPQTTEGTSSVNRRRTVFSSKLSHDFSLERSSAAPITPIGDGVPSSTLIGEESVKTPVQLGTLFQEHASATIFSSTKTPVNPRRRTLFDVSMDIISQRLLNINQSAKSVRLPRLDDLQNKDRRSSVDDSDTIAALLTPTDDNKSIRKELFGNEDPMQIAATSHTTTVPGATATLAANIPGDVLQKKKRKLFVPNDIMLTPTPPSSTSTESDDNAVPKRTRIPDTPTASTTTTTKRRKTIMPMLTQPKAEQKKTLPKNNGAVGRSSRRSTMDFEAINKSKSVNKKSETAPDETATQGETVVGKPKPYPFLVYTNMHTEQIKFIKEAITALPGFQLEDNVSDKTTHIVSLEPRRTINLLRGLVRGLWIVNYNWILDSVKAGKWLNEEQYELRDFSRAVEICRSERQAFGHAYRMDLFSALGPMYISMKSNIPRETLKELVLLCAGRVVDRRQRAKYIIGDSSPVLLPDKFYLDPQWILDSISNNQIQKLTKYIVTNTTEVKVEDH